ncbi:signal recognition particle-docking protein FtsY [Candidatus Aenigmatarchaeota archaeon]
MFGRLKKKLSEAIKKVTKDTEVEETKEPKEEPKIFEDVKEIISEPAPELTEKEEETVQEILEEQTGPAESEEEIASELDKPVIEEIKEEIQEEKSNEVQDTSIDNEPAIEEITEEIKEIEEPKAEISELIREEKEKIEPESILDDKDDKEELAPIVEEIKEIEQPGGEISKEISEVREQKKGIFGKLVKKVTEKVLTDNDLDKILIVLKKTMLENDVAFGVAEKIADDIKRDLTGKEVKRSQSEEFIKDSLRRAMLDVMQKERVSLVEMAEGRKAFSVLFLGFNGVGKTTTMAKVTKLLQKDNKKIVFAAGDTFRAASMEQLEIHAERLGVNVIKHKYGSDSAAVIFDAIKHASSNNIDFVLADTAGRSHSNANLMDELKKICRVNNPDMKILILDSLTGNDIYEQSRLFDEAVGIDAIILTKADVYEKGGAALSASYTIKKPIIYLGVGQEYDDIREFDPEEIVKILVE